MILLVNVSPKEALPETTNDAPYVIIVDEAFPLKNVYTQTIPWKTTRLS